MSARFFDDRGCLTPAGFAALESAPAGQGPKELAAHLAGCARCQDRLLAAAESGVASAAGRVPAPKRTAAPPPLWRAVAAFMGLLLLTLLALLLASRRS